MGNIKKVATDNIIRLVTPSVKYHLSVILNLENGLTAYHNPFLYFIVTVKSPKIKYNILEKIYIVENFKFLFAVETIISDFFYKSENFIH